MKTAPSNTNVLFIARRFPPSVGGMERFAYDLSTAIGERVRLRKLTWGGSNKWLPLVFVGFFFRALFMLWTDRRIQVIHMQDAVQAPIGWLLSKLSGRPYLVVAHGLDITFSKMGYQSLILPFVRRADRVISISSATQDEVRFRRVATKRSQVITLGTSDDYGSPQPNRPALEKALGISLKKKIILLTTGRLVRRKGVAWFITHVLPTLTKKHPNIMYVVVGDGGQREAIEQAIAGQKMSGHVVMAGRVDDQTRSLLYQSADIFVMPNIVVPGDMEGFGIVAHEAATAAIPVVASNLEGIADAIKDGKNGILVEPENAIAFVTQLESLIKASEKQRRALGEAFRDYTLAMYSWSHIADQYITVYQSLIRTKR